MGECLSATLRGGKKRAHKAGRIEILHQFDVRSVNTGGVPGIYRLLELIRTGKVHADVVCMQETRASPEDERVLEMQWTMAGFYVYTQPGAQTTGADGIVRYHGGLMTAVRKALKQKIVYKAKNQSCQALDVEVQGWHCLQFYNPPRDYDNLHSLLVEALVELATTARDRWMVCGDFNETRIDTSAILLQAFGFEVVEKMEGESEATRWDGHREVDWIAVNWPEKAEKSWQEPYKISDHKIQATRLTMHDRRGAKVGKLKRGPDWRCPKHLTKTEWREFLLRVWHATEELESFPIAVGKTTNSIEEDWLEWLRLLDAFYRAAFTKALEDIEEKLNCVGEEKMRETLIDSKAAVQQQLNNSKVKGVQMEYVQEDEMYKVRIESDKAGQRAKHRKTIGRLCSLRQLIKKHGISMIDHLEEMIRLKKKVGWGLTAEMGANQAIQWISDTMQRKEREIHRMEQEKRKARLDRWKQNMKELKEISKWVKNRSKVSTRLISGAQTRDEVCAKIRQFWLDEWKSLDTEEPDQARQDVQEALILPMNKWMEDKVVPVWTDEDRRDGTRKAFKNARGAAGPDGYHGDEVSVLPEPLQEIFHDITGKWLEQRVAPEDLRHMIQASLQKPGKPAVVENVRPLAIFSVFWRLFESGLLRTEAFNKWRQTVGIPEVAWKEAAEEVAAGVGNCYALQKFLAALDFSKAYDFMAPAKSQELMEAAKLPPNIAQLFGTHWSNQVRHVTFDGHMARETSSTDTAHPQGGPWGPVVIQLWMIAGSIWAKEQMRSKIRIEVTEPSKEIGSKRALHGDDETTGQRAKKPRNEGREMHQDRADSRVARSSGSKRKIDEQAEKITKRQKSKTKVYMDDRSIIASEAKAMLMGVQLWEEWSDKVQLKENASKKQLVAKGPAAKLELSNELQQQRLTGWDKFVVDEAEVLGAVIGNTTLAPKEVKRIDKFKERASLMDTLPIPRATMIGFKRAIAMSVLAYGWLFRHPQLAVLNKCASLMMGRTLRNGSRQLKYVMEGATVHPFPVFLCRLFNMTLLAKQKFEHEEYFGWAKAPQHSVGHLRNMMQYLGWEEQAPFKWVHHGLEAAMEITTAKGVNAVEVNKSLEKTKKVCSHWIRESFRFMHWERYWATSKRHEVTGIKSKKYNLAYPANRLSKARRLADDAVSMALFVGAFMSPGNFKDGSRPFTDRCLCCDSIGYHDHIMWECRKVRDHYRDSFGDAPIATDLLQRRYGLPLATKESAKLDVLVLQWMKLIVTEVWKVRYGTDDADKAIQASIAKKRRISEDQRRKDEAAQADEELTRWLLLKAAYDEDSDASEADDDAA